MFLKMGGGPQITRYRYTCRGPGVLKDRGGGGDPQTTRYRYTCRGPGVLKDGGVILRLQDINTPAEDQVFLKMGGWSSDHKI